MAEQCLDRLSSLPDDILIRILSLFPIQFAIVTGCLSTRWRSLWKNITSVDIPDVKLATMSEFSAVVRNIMSQITSPSIHRFTVIFDKMNESWNSQPYDYFWLRQISDRDVRELNLTWRGFHLKTITLPSFIIRSASLVSMVLEGSFVWLLPCNDHPINLPNLRYLSVTSLDSHCECLYNAPKNKNCGCLRKLIRACPSLEELNLNFKVSLFSACFMLSNPNLMRLTLNFTLNDGVIIVINAPKLEYFDITAPTPLTHDFGKEEPRGLREAKICLDDVSNPLELNQSISNVRFLTLVFYSLQVLSTVFHYAKHVTLLMSRSYDTTNLQRLTEFFPVLDVLSLKCKIADDDNEEESVPQKYSNVSTLLRGVKRITVESTWYGDLKPRKDFLEFLAYLLCNAVDLEHFHFTFDRNKYYRKKEAESILSWELDFCKFLYYCPMISVGCEAEFVGLYLKMSRNAGPKAWNKDGIVTPFNDSAWNSLVFVEP